MGRQSEGNSRVLRFNRTERLVHWTQAVTFLVLMATGLAISISGLQAVFGHRAFLREIHLVTAFFFVFGPAVVALAGDRWSIRKDIEAVDDWSSDDLRWLAHPSLQANAYTSPAGRYNAGQKLNAIFTVYATLAFAVTGLIIWQNRRFPFALVSQANSIHTYLAYIALIVFLGHVFLSVVYPATRNSLSGIITGTVDQKWAQDHHPLWQPEGWRDSGVSIRSTFRSVVLVLIGLEAALLVTRFGLEWLGANVTDPVTKMIYRFSGLPGTHNNLSTGIHHLDLAALIWLGLALAIGYAVLRRESLLPNAIPAPLQG